MITRNNDVGSYMGGYHLVAEIASGPVSRVFLGKRFSATGEEHMAAIKLLHPISIALQQNKDGFLQEINFLKQLHHPHILPLLDAGMQGDTAYVISEYAVGGSLYDRMQHNHALPLPTDEALQVITQIGQALQYAHFHNVLHCNLKPQNILFTAQDDAQLTDFSLATLPTTFTSTAADSSAYMAPEQFVGIVSKESDQYALGCIAYEMFTGHPPYEGKPGSQHKIELLVLPTQLNPALPPHIEQAILTSMAKGLTQRHSGIQAFLTALTTSPEVAKTLSIVPETPPSLAVEDQPTLAGLDMLDSSVPLTMANFLPTDLQPSDPLDRRTIADILPQYSNGQQAFQHSTQFAFNDQPQLAFQGNISQRPFAIAEDLVRPEVDARSGLFPMGQVGLLSSIKGVPDRNRPPAGNKIRSRRELMLILIACVVVIASVSGILFFMFSATQKTAITPAHTTATTPAHATTAATSTTAQPSATAIPTPTATSVPILIITPTAAPTATATATPSPTSTPTLTMLLTLSSTSFSPKNCRNQGVDFNCKVTLSLSANAQNKITWKAASSGFSTYFSPSNGTLSPGQRAHINMYIFAACKTAGSITFTTSIGTITAHWGC